jgi:hypothetical protein
MSSSLYNLIRERAGSEMLRQAESMKMYDQVSDFLSDNLTSEALDLAMEFHKNYPREAPFTPMGHINLLEVCSIADKELETLPWIYVHMLETLVSQDDLASKVLKEKLAASPAAAWRMPTPEGVSNGDAFAHIFNEWVSQNGWVESFESWATRHDEDDYADLDMCSRCTHDLDDCRCQFACGCTRDVTCMDCTSGGGRGPPPTPSSLEKRYDYIGFLCSKKR